MILKDVIRSTLMLSAAVVLCAGCRKGGGNAGSSVTVEQVPATMESAFRNAPEELKTQATEAASAVQSQNDSSAFVQLDGLTRRTDLTPEQRQAAFASWM